MVYNRFRQLGDIQDLQKATTFYQETVHATAADHVDRVDRLHRLGTHFANRFKLLGASSDLAKAIQATKEALAAASSNDPLRLRLLVNIGVYLSVQKSMTKYHPAQILFSRPIPCCPQLAVSILLSTINSFIFYV